MEKVFYFIILIVCYSIDILAQDISGQYYRDKSDYKIVVDGSHFYYIEKESHQPIWSIDTLANCSYEWAGKDFIKINSYSPNLAAVASMIISQSQDSIFNDSIRVMFDMPYDSPLLIDISDDRFNSYSFKWTKKSEMISLPKNIKKISFCISPYHIKVHKADGRFFGIAGLDPFIDIQVGDNIDTVKISIPKLDNSFFEQYYIVDEYVKVKNNCIYWKGDKFKKR